MLTYKSRRIHWSVVALLSEKKQASTHRQLEQMAEDKMTHTWNNNNDSLSQQKLELNVKSILW